MEEGAEGGEHGGRVRRQRPVPVRAADAEVILHGLVQRQAAVPFHPRDLEAEPA